MIHPVPMQTYIDILVLSLQSGMLPFYAVFYYLVHVRGGLISKHIEPPSFFLKASY